MEDFLSDRERQVVQMIADGFTDRDIATHLSISDKTASTHRKNILRKLRLKNTAMLVRYALENRLIR